MLKVLASVAIAFVAACSASAQNKAEVFGGYSFVRSQHGLNLHGGEASLTASLSRVFGVEAAFGGHTGSKRSTDLLSLPPAVPFPGGPFQSFDVSTRLYTYLIGPRVRANAGRATPYVHALFGVAHTSGTASLVFFDPGSGLGPSTFTTKFGETSFAMELGGGVNVRVTDRVSVRVVEVDYLRTQFAETYAGDNRQNGARFSTGLVVTFGNR